MKRLVLAAMFLLSLAAVGSQVSASVPPPSCPPFCGGGRQ